MISLNSSRRYLVSSLGKDNGSALLNWRQRATAQALQRTVITCGEENRLRAMLTSVSVAKEALAQAIVLLFLYCAHAHTDTRNPGGPRLIVQSTMILICPWCNANTNPGRRPRGKSPFFWEPKSPQEARESSRYFSVLSGWDCSEHMSGLTSWLWGWFCGWLKIMLSTPTFLYCVQRVHSISHPHAAQTVTPSPRDKSHGPGSPQGSSSCLAKHLSAPLWQFLLTKQIPWLAEGRCC